MSYTDLIRSNFEASSELIIRSIAACSDSLENAINVSIKAYESGGTLFFAGNGGSAADACHIASELVGSFESNDAPLPAISLATDVAILTSVANDFSFQSIFLQQARAMAKRGDLIWLISTSGQSDNIFQVAAWAREKGIGTVGLLGRDGGRIASQVEIPIIVPGKNTQRIQEVHILILHTLASALKARFPEGIKTGK